MHIEEVFKERHSCTTNLQWFPFDTITCKIIQFTEEPISEVIFRFADNSTEEIVVSDQFHLPGWISKNQWSQITIKVGEKTRSIFFVNQ